MTPYSQASVPLVYHASINWMRKTEEGVVYKRAKVQSTFLDVLSLQ